MVESVNQFEIIQPRSQSHCFQSQELFEQAAQGHKVATIKRSEKVTTTHF